MNMILSRLFLPTVRRRAKFTFFALLTKFKLQLKVISENGKSQSKHRDKTKALTFVSKIEFITTCF